MEHFHPNKHHLREVLLHYFYLKKSAAESFRILCDAYGDGIIGETTCRDWFRRFKLGDFDVLDKEREGQPKKFEDAELEALLNEDSTQTQQELADSLGVDRTTISKRLKALGMIQRQGN